MTKDVHDARSAGEKRPQTQQTSSSSASSSEELCDKFTCEGPGLREAVSSW